MKVHEISPILWTKNLPETIAFYKEVLGFSGESSFPDFVSLAKDDARLMFVVPQEEPEDRKDDKDSFFQRSCLTGSIYFFIENVDECWDRVKDQARIKSPIADRAYLMRDFSILDNNGYELVFGQDISNR